MQEDFKRVKNELPLSEQDGIKNMDITHEGRANTYLNAKNMLKDLDDEEVEDIDDEDSEESDE